MLVSTYVYRALGGGEGRGVIGWLGHGCSELHIDGLPEVSGRRRRMTDLTLLNPLGSH